MILVDTRWHSGLYDYDGKVLSKVLKVYRSDDTFTFKRFNYAYNEDYKEVKKRDIELYKDNYYDDNGNLVFS